MPELDLIKIFISRLNKLEINYITTGAVASIIYGTPRLTHDLDLVIDMDHQEIDKFVATFPLKDFYCPPPEIIEIEINRHHRGHFNLIHHTTGFKADIYPCGQSALHKWAFENKKAVDFEKETLWVAPVEYVILRKLEYYREGKSEKHLSDIVGILEISSNQIDFNWLYKKIDELKLTDEWEKITKS